jgi:tRNA(Arg) A34 adenosine deaminase TadA
MFKRNDFFSIIDLMKYSLEKIRASEEIFDVPIYAILLKNFEIVDETKNIGKKHAEEILLERNNIFSLDILVNLEPCPSCLFKLMKFGIRNIFFGGFNYQYGSCGGKFHLSDSIIFDTFSKKNIFGGFLKQENEDLMKKFFQKIR